jgi:hypothetical protein
VVQALYCAYITTVYIITYRRLKGYTQAQLNDFVFDYAKREVTADYTFSLLPKVSRLKVRVPLCQHVNLSTCQLPYQLCQP